MHRLLLATAIATLTCHAQSNQPWTLAPTLAYAEAQPGTAKGEQQGSRLTLSNALVSATWSVEGGKLKPVSLTVGAETKAQTGAEAFRLGIEGAGLPAAGGFVPANIDASACEIVGKPKLEKIAAEPSAHRGAPRFGGWRIVVDLKEPASGTRCRWTAELRDGSHYFRQTLQITGEKGALSGITALDCVSGAATQSGTAAAGNPLVTGKLFLGVEQPMAKNDLSGERVKSGVACKLPLQKGVIYEVSSVVGAYPDGQLRRAFLRYLERERATPYSQFLHYNGWFDFDRSVNEKGMLDTLAAYKKDFIGKHGVPVRAFIVDDGWDDWDAGFWQVNAKKFPNGFTRLGAELVKAGSRFGIWISPLGGYDHSDQRAALAAKEGLTPPGTKTLDLSYPPYFDWFLKECTDFIKKDKVAYFKFDKAGNGVNAHFLALLRICRELKKVDPALVINITVGTWPSPFWLNHIDCTWREGNDMGYEGPGSDREQWITYRDAQTWRGVVSKGPLYPLNSIMNHGICLSDGHPFPKRALKSGTDLRNEARTFFGSGTLMQELYVKPAITSAETWSQLAEAAKWAKANADILVDTHWVGGNPSGGKELYGWAAWSPRKALLTLRNPSAEAKSFALDVAKVFELPAAAAKSYAVKSAYADTPSPLAAATAGKSESLSVPPFGVLVLEFSPR